MADTGDDGSSKAEEQTAAVSCGKDDTMVRQERWWCRFYSTIFSSQARTSRNATTNQNGHVTSVSYVSYINCKEDDEMQVYGYTWSRIRSTLTWLGVILTAGVLRLIFHWYPQLQLYATHVPCPLNFATKLLVVDNYLGRYDTYFVKEIKTLKVGAACVANGITKDSAKQLNQGARIQLNNGSSKDVQEVRVVRIKKLWYVWDEDTAEFVKLAGLDRGVTKTELHQYIGYNEQQQELRRSVYGFNDIPVEVQSVWVLLFLEVINPFYIFQFFSLCVWASEGYYYYLIAIVLMSVFGISSSIIQTRRNQQSLHDTVHSSDVVTVCRGGDQYQEVSTLQLVPGDVIVIPPHGCDMHCDAVLLDGTCIVNESMLTGESVPVNKTFLPKQAGVLYNHKEDASHTLFCGTKVIQTRYYGNEKVRAVVIRTGFLTAKGSLVRSILYPPPADFKFDQDSYKFIGILAVIAALGIIYTIVIKVGKEIVAGDVAIKALDLITIVIPPALPAALTVGKLYAQNRLQASKIFCINSRVINVAGSINCVCFDKTGTLTEDGLDMWGVLPVSDQKFQLATREVKRSPLELGMATCHSLTLINSELSGDPLDVKMFESTGWKLEEPEVADQEKYDLMVPTVVKSPAEIGKEDPIEIGLVHQFQFSSTLQRMSVVTRTLGAQDFVLYCKGSPEMITSLSLPETVPEDLSSVLQEYTEQGYRVIALGRRTLAETSYTKIQRMQREEVEKDLEFLGMIVLENRLKPQTTGIIDVLKGAHVKMVMITGDNILTAVSVAKECGIIEPGESVVDVTATPKGVDTPAEVFCTTTAQGKTVMNGGCDAEAGNLQVCQKLALTGKTWAVIRENFPDLIPRLCTRGAVFARMSSEQKQQLVEELQGLGYYVAMCGDGANDCGALKAAHVGISLSEAESSVASPFTSKEANISCVPKVISEGRAALSTSSGIFRFMVAYSLTEFLSCIILYAIESNLTDLQFLFIDICLIVNFAFFFGKTRAYAGPLVQDPPLTSLLSFIPLMSIFLHILIIAAIQLISFFVVRQFEWYKPFKTNADIYANYENYAVYSVSLFQYITSAIVFSQGKPYRKEIYTNTALISSLAIMSIICIVMTVYPPQWMLNIMESVATPYYDFRIIAVCLGVINLIVSLFVENLIVNDLLDTVVRPLWKKYTGLGFKEKKFLTVEHQVMEENWPPISNKAAVPISASVTELRTPVQTVDIQMKVVGGGDVSPSQETTDLDL